MRMQMMAGVAAMMIAAELDARDPNIRRVVENRGQAMPKGALKAVRGSRVDRRSSSRRAGDELVRMSSETLVVAHLHPRWLRAEVERLMDGGAVVTHSMVDQLRTLGPDLAVLYAQQVMELARGS